MKKNIVFYFSDQQRADTISPDITPNLCALAENGWQFNNNYTCQPVCGPARACLQSGKYATQVGCFRNAISLPEDEKTLAHYFNENGYQTAYIGKWHLASDSFPGQGGHYEKTAVPERRRGGYSYWRAADVLEFTSHGYDGYVFDENEKRHDFKGYRADAINDFALEFLDNRDKTKPFFLFVSQLEPHHQNDRHAFEAYKPTAGLFADRPIPSDLAFLKGDYNEQYPAYLSCVNRLDYNVGRLIEKLKELNIYDDTIVLYTSDHGCHFKTRNLEYKRCCHENTVRTPLIISGGDFIGGKQYDGLTGLIDLPPTLFSMAGIPIPDSYVGTDIALQLKDESSRHDSIFIQISESQCGRAIRYKNYMYSVSADTETGYLLKSSPVYREEYLYDLSADPDEKVNLIKNKDYESIRKECKTKLFEEISKAGEKRPIILPAIFAKNK